MKGIAVLPQGLEEEGASELSNLGAKEVIPLKRCASFKADISCLYRLYLNARMPFSILREIAKFNCKGPKSLYREVQHAFDWETWLHPSMSLRVDVSGTSQGLTHSHFTALQVKNAIIDLQMDLWGDRSNIDLINPDLCIHLHLNQEIAVLSLNGTASSMHRRGYRSAVGKAPLKENIATGLIRITGWDGSTPLIDPLCGSGTLLIEAVNLVLNIPPSIHHQFIVENWSDFDSMIWKKEKDYIKKKQNQKRKDLPLILGCEKSNNTYMQASANINSANLESHIKINNGYFQDLKLPKSPGLIICNPPYGKRISSEESLPKLYEELGRFLKQKASGWELWLLSGNPSLTKSLRMKCSRRIPISNGGIDCRWLKYEIH